MPSRGILLLDQKAGAWQTFLNEYFEETASRLNFFDQPAQASAFLAQQPADFIFVNPALSSVNLNQKLKAMRESCPGLRLFSVHGFDKTLPYDDFFDPLPDLGVFRRKFLPQLVFPDILKILLVDDEKDIGWMIRDFLEDRVQPKFEVQYTPDGKQALEWLQIKNYDAVVLDVKMPVMDGRDIYREIISRKIKIPVIMFFDAISGQEVSDLHKIGCPAIVDKGSNQSSMPEMLALIKKMVYFS